MTAHGPVDIFRHVMGHKGFDYNKIGDNLFVGTNMCCEYGFSKELLSKGVRADISLEEDRTDAPDGVDYFFWLPTKDGEAPEPDKLEIAVQLLDSLLKNRVSTFVHCKNGHGRAPTLVAAYFIKHGMGVQEAIHRVSSQRPSIHPTPAQVKALEAFKASTAGR